MPGPWGAAIQALREQRRTAPGSQPRHWTQAAVAKRAGMTATSYGKIEKGGHTLTSKLRDIADVFDVPIEYVLMPTHPLAEDRQVARVLAVLTERLRPVPVLPPLSPADVAHEALKADIAHRQAEKARQAEASKKRHPVRKRHKIR